MYSLIFLNLVKCWLLCERGLHDAMRANDCWAASVRQAENSRIESEAALQSVVKELQSELTEQQQMWWRLEADCRNLSTLLAQVPQSCHMIAAF